MLGLAVPAWEIVARAIAVYVALLVAFRVFGKREIGQFTLYDLVFVLLVANAVQPAVTGPDTSLAGGVLIVATLALVNFAVSRLVRLPVFARAIEPRPAILIKDGRVLEDALRREGVDREELASALREHGFADPRGVALGVLEPDGTISIVPLEAPMTRSHRRIRARRGV